MESCGCRPGEEGVIFVSPTMRRKRYPNGYIRFSMDVQIGDTEEWIGHRLVLFRVTNGTGVVGIYLPDGIDVLPKHERG